MKALTVFALFMMTISFLSAESRYSVLDSRLIPVARFQSAMLFDVLEFAQLQAKDSDRESPGFKIRVALPLKTLQKKISFRVKGVTFRQFLDKLAVEADVAWHQKNDHILFAEKETEQDDAIDRE